MIKNKVFIVLVNYNSQAFIKPCLESLKKQSFKAFSLIVVDNNSVDTSLKLIKKSFPQVKLILNKKNLGFPAAVNQGVRWALKRGAEKIIFLGFDTRTEKDWLKNLIKASQEFSQAGIVQSKILLYPSKKIQSLGNRIHFLGFGYPSAKLQKKLDYASGTAMLVKKEVFKRIGFFDERLMFMEDLDFGWRARRVGFEIRLAPQSVVHHQYEFQRYTQKFYFLERARKLVLLKNLSLGGFFLRLPLLLMVEVAVFGYSIATGWFKDKLKAEYYFWQNLKKLRK